jgi:hypothetical protein
MNSGPGSIAVAVAPCAITTRPAGAGRFPGPRPSDPLVGISPSLGRSIPRIAAAEPLGGDSTASPGSIPANLRGTVQGDASRRRCHGSWQRGRRLRRAES